MSIQKQRIFGISSLASVALVIFAHAADAADVGLITKLSSHSAKDTVERFESAVRAKGWIVFTEIDHAGAAKQVGLDMKPRTVVVFGNPKLGTGPMQKSGTYAIENPPKALVWEDDNGKVWLTYNSASYINGQLYPRHGLSMPPADMMANFEQFLADVSDQAVK